MDPKKIGKLIYELRIKNGLTQKDLAEKLLVTSQAISKWENGRGIPDIEMIQKLSEIFNVNIDELLCGEVNSKKSNFFKRNIVFILVILFVIILLILLIFFKDNNDNFKISTLSSNNDAFSIKGIIAYNENKKSIYISSVEYDSFEDEEKYKNLECILYEANGDIEKKISQCSSVENEYDESLSLSELLKDIEFNVDDYSCSCNMPVCNQLYLKINAVNLADKMVTYNIPIELESKCMK